MSALSGRDVAAAPGRRARVIVLVGPKGAGKSTIGRMIERRFGAHFLDVESVARRVLAEMGGTIDERYARRAFDEILEAIRHVELEYPVITIETTGASEETSRLLATLRERYELRVVRITATRQTCLERIESRDSERQVPVPRDMIELMHARSVALELPWDLQLDNDPALSEEEVTRRIAPLIGKDTAPESPAP